MQYSASYPIPQKMRDTINNCVGGLGAVGVVGGAIGPGADLVVIAPTWVGMTCTLAAQAGQRMDEDTAKKLAVAVATGAGSFAIGTKIAATVGGWLLALPSGGLSLFLAMAGNAALNAKFTDAYGKSVARYFLQRKTNDNELAAKILIAMLAIQFGVSSPSSDVIA
jgi:uncharacterized protein (DUF697 family)